MITEDFCSSEIVKLLKEKGFICGATYSKGFVKDGDGFVGGLVRHEDKITHQMAMKWLREVHNILIVVSITYEKERYDWYICGIKGDPWEKELFHEEKDVTYTTFEEAVEAAIKYCLTKVI